MKFITGLILFTVSSVCTAQVPDVKLDSLFNLYVKIKTISAAESPVQTDTPVTKCAFSVVNQVRTNYNRFNPGQKVILQKLFSRPVTQTSKLTPSNLFRVNYDTSGTEAVKYDVNAFASALDSIYVKEVIEMGYLPPPSTSGVYDIYVVNTGGLYGYTELEDNITDHTFYSFIVLDNDFASMNTKGLNGARVTAAHEMHHAIQLGNYTYNSDDIFFHELSSTAMEEFVYDYINDYYYYMDEFFSAPDVAMPIHSGYDLAIWNLYLADQFGMDILKRQWEMLYGKRAVEAIALSIGEKNSNFQDVFSKFGIWTYFTGYRHIPGKYFEEGENYPVVVYTIEKPLEPGIDSLNLQTQPVTFNYITLTNSMNSSQTDTLTVLIANSDFRQAGIDPGVYESVLYEISADSTSELEQLVPGYYRKLTTSNPAFWASSEFLNNQLIKEGFVRVEGTDAFPSPFKYSKHSFIYIPAEAKNGGQVDFQVYSSSMDLVYSAKKDIFRMFGKDIISWNGKDNSDNRLGSGVYIYFIKSGEDITSGKIVIFND